MADKKHSVEHNSFLYFAIPYTVVSQNEQNYCVDKKLKEKLPEVIPSPTRHFIGNLKPTDC